MWTRSGPRLQRHGAVGSVHARGHPRLSRPSALAAPQCERWAQSLARSNRGYRAAMVTRVRGRWHVQMRLCDERDVLRRSGFRSRRADWGCALERAERRRSGLSVSGDAAGLQGSVRHLQGMALGGNGVPQHSFQSSGVPYKLVDGIEIQVVEGYDDLTVCDAGGCLANPIDADETGFAGVVGTVWTGTNSAGIVLVETCGRLVVS